MQYTNVCLHEFGYVLPPVVLTSAALEEQLKPVYDRLKLPAGRLELMTGITARRLWPAGTRPSEGAAQAGALALAKANVPARDISCLIFTSVSRDMMEPATASFVHSRLELPAPCLLFDISNACLGFLDGMIMLANMIELGQVETGLVVAGETAEDLIASTVAHLVADTALTRKTIKPLFASLTIGSGAVALVMSSRRYRDTGHFLSGGACYANTRYNTLCQGGQNAEQGTLMSTDSEQLLEKGIETAADCWRAFLENLAWHPESIDRYFCHQVGKAHAQRLLESLQLDPAKNFETLPHLGNVGSVSAPITLALGLEQGQLKPGQRGAILGIGSGINTLMLGIDW